MEEDNTSKKDIWDKIDIIAKVFIPIAIVFLTILYNQSQQDINTKNNIAKTKIDEENRKADRLTSLIKHLSSTNTRERIIAINVAGVLYSNRQLPDDINATIIEAVKSSNKEEAKAALSFVKVKLSGDISKASSRDGAISGISANDNVLIYPKIDGDDVVVPDLLIKAIPGFEDRKAVYAANDINGWLVSGKNKANTETLRLTIMKREGNNWRAYGMAAKRFHPAQLINSNLSDPFNGSNVGWAKIENVYNLSDPFVDMSGSGPCLLVK